MKLIGDYLDKIGEAKNKIENRFLETNLVFSFRGEHKDYENTRLMPSLFRNGITNVKALENKLMESLADFDISKQDDSLLKRSIEAQHYIGPAKAFGAFCTDIAAK